MSGPCGAGERLPGNERPIRFWHQGRVTDVHTPEATRSVLDWLREDQRCTGTKEGCAEGDCGACTVVIGELDAQGQLQLRPANACIQFLPTLDGKALFTVEDVGGHRGQPLHPVQQALVDCHGSQCGFCTPGFVMSLWACWEARHGPAGHGMGAPPRQADLADALAGNLCRCTGYRPILEAGVQALGCAAPPLSREPVTQALRELAQDPPLKHGSFWAPRALDDFAQHWRARAQADTPSAPPSARLLAGSTDIGLWVTKQHRTLGDLVYLGRLDALRQVQEEDGMLCIGAAVPLEDAWAALVARWPSLQEVARRFAAPPVRAQGTLGGNVANGSPIGDGAPVLMALGAELELQRGAQRRRLPLHSFYTGYQQNQLQPGEFLRALHVPLAPGWQVEAYKISKRFDSDISAVLGALAVRLGPVDGAPLQVLDVRLAWGGMAATVRRAPRAEAALRGGPWSAARVRAAQRALAEDFQPLSDLRASAAYRLQVAQNLLWRWWLSSPAGRAEWGGEAAGDAEWPLSVWSRA